MLLKYNIFKFFCKWDVVNLLILGLFDLLKVGKRYLVGCFGLIIGKFVLR